jgi:hypothetical protein
LQVAASRRSQAIVDEAIAGRNQPSNTSHSSFQ